mgnify:CR=1 FL=1
MATFKRCSNCHQLFTGKECPVCRAKMAAAYQKRRLCMNESTRRYHSRVWQRCRKAVILKYSGYDVWLLGIGIWEKCDPAYVHHIVEIFRLFLLLYLFPHEHVFFIFLQFMQVKLY